MTDATAEKKCPKCGSFIADEVGIERANRSSNGKGNQLFCAKCGLNIVRFDPDKALLRGSAHLKKLWDNVVSDWENSAKHALFLETALAEESGAFAAQCYRSRLPDLRAERQIDALVKRLMTDLMSQQAERHTGPSRVAWIVAFVCILLLLALAMLFVIP